MVGYGWIFVAASVLLAGHAHAEDTQACVTHYKQEGNFMLGRRFSTWGTVATPQPQAFKQIYRDAIKSGMKVVSSDKDVGALTLEQPNAGTTFGGNDDQVSLHWDILVEENGNGSKISVNNSTPPSYSVSKKHQMTLMCQIIASGAGKS